MIPAICGDDLSQTSGPVCPATVQGPRLIQGGQTSWRSAFTALAGSEITITTFDTISDFIQPNEQVFVRIGNDVYGPTPAGRGSVTFDVINTGEVTVLHYSVIEGPQNSQNSVEFSVCGNGLVQTGEGN